MSDLSDTVGAAVDVAKDANAESMALYEAFSVIDHEFDDPLCHYDFGPAKITDAGQRFMGVLITEMLAAGFTITPPADRK